MQNIFQRAARAAFILFAHNDQINSRSAAINPQVCPGFNLIAVARDNILLSQSNASGQIARAVDKFIRRHYILEEFPGEILKFRAYSLFTRRSHDNRIICRHSEK